MNNIIKYKFQINYNLLFTTIKNYNNNFEKKK